ncbi:unnamed protein product [Bursaphelenchus xylophilus]|uniref:(pine wood nematode) hypothetical protein n=1 Tax=Bursaphelenchus xylophilus TaxID=6326 RepID=A0A1I7S3S4_BURXY|nr:unnamed protein product [Bursaphelenchus xylophilus]CAG9116495.1 unnamed protein product [Bursaphelenchus xylophilus]
MTENSAANKTSEMAKRMFSSARKRKLEETTEKEINQKAGTSDSNDNSADAKTTERDELLRQKAKQALLRESARGKQRAERMGSEGWIRPTSLNTNKIFLNRMVQSTLSKSLQRPQPSTKHTDKSHNDLNKSTKS